MRNIPIYRAKSLKTEKYVEGFLKTCTDTGEALWIQTKDLIDYMIDENTLAIHFPDMIDLEGKKIFASLQEDGNGGDIIKVINGCEHNPYYRNGEFTFEDFPMTPCRTYNGEDTKLIGIKENIK